MLKAPKWRPRMFGKVFSMMANTRSRFQPKDPLKKQRISAKAMGKSVVEIISLLKGSIAILVFNSDH